MKNLYYFIHLTGRDQGNTGIQRVVRNLGWALQELGRRDFSLIPVRWCHLSRAIVHAEPEFLETIKLFGGPKFNASEQAGKRIPTARSDGDWLLIPEVPHLGNHDPRYPSVQIGPVIGCAKNMGLRVAAVFHDILPLLHEEVIAEGLLNQHRFMVYAQALTNLDLIIPNSTSSKISLNDWLMTNGVSAARLPLALDLPLPEEMRGVPRQIIDPRRIAATPTKSFNFISLGTVCKRKNQLAAIEAFDRVRRKNPQYEMHFDLIGHIHPEVAAGLRQVLSLTDGHVRACGYLPDDHMRQLWRNAHASVFVSLAEGYGLPVAESMWMSVPCIASGAGAVGDIAMGGGCLTVDPKDVDSIAAAFERMIHEDDVHRRLLQEIAGRPLRTWTDYAADVANGLFENAAARTLIQDTSSEKVNISANSLICHRAYERNGFQTLRNAHQIHFIKSTHGGIDEPHLFHGPYIHITPGAYSVSIEGELSGSIKIQFLQNGGELIAEFNVKDFSKRLDVVFTSAITDFEIRGVRNHDTERVSVTRFVLHKRGATIRDLSLVSRLGSVGAEYNKAS